MVFPVKTFIKNKAAFVDLFILEPGYGCQTHYLLRMISIQ